MDQMADSFDLQSHDMVALSRATFDALRSAMMRDNGLAGATQLQEAGFAGGESLYASFRNWLRERAEADAGELPPEEFGQRASAFFEAAGWGTFRLEALDEAVATVDSTDWREADPATVLDHPGCHLTTGILAGFFSAAGDAPIAALEVECRSAGNDRCRFLIGAGPVLTHVFEQVEQGAEYAAVVRGLEGG
jgi:predicted hydrocarbon binding protein